MLIKLPIAWIIALNVIGWPVIHLWIAKLFLSLNTTHFKPMAWSFRKRRWELDGHFYEKVILIRSWKHILPDGAPFLKGFAKRKLASVDRAYLQAFIVETCRGEMAHWVMMLAAPLFFFWNPLWADGVICVYAVAANMPCIATQRYNRIRLNRIAISSGIALGRAH